MWRIYDYKGIEKAVVHEVEYEGNEGGMRTLTCSISSPIPIAWEVTDNISYRGEIFHLRHIPQAKKQARVLTHKEAFVYDNVVFYSAIDELASCDFLDVVKEDNNLHYTSLPNFSFYCETIYDIADRLQANLDRLYTGANKWTIQVSTDITAKVDIKPQVLSFSSEKCSQVLERIYNDLGVAYEHTNRTIVFGAKSIIMPYEFQYGKGKGLKSIEQSGADGNALVTRARVYGSTRNLPNRYYNKLYKNSKTGAVKYFKTDEDKPKNFEAYWKPLISETMYVPNLMLPMFRENGKDAYIDATDAIAKYGLREGTKFFDSNNGEDEEIYPTIENMTADRLEGLGYTPELHDGDNGKLDELLYVDDVPFSGVMPEGGSLPSSESHFVVYLKDIGFDINDYLVGTPKISFRSGALAGREFDIVKCEQTALINKTYKLTCKRVEDTSIQLIFPYKDYKPSAGDKFVLLEIDMPEIYIKVAEVRLKEEGDKWLGLNSNPIFTYNPEIDAVNVLRNPQIAENLKEGRTFVFSDEDLGISKAIRISNLKIKDNGFAPEYEITLSDKHTVSLAEKVTQSVVNMIGSNNASTENIKALIEAYGNNLFLSKKKRDTADQVIRFSLGLEVGENKATINANGDAEVESLTSRSRVKASEVVADSIHTTDYAQGALLGTGGAIYQLEGATYAEFDYLTARKGATFAELIIQKYRSIGGALVISQANGEIESVYDYGNGYNIWIKDDDRSDSLFVNNDLVRCQYWDRGKNELVYYWIPVSVSEDSQGRYVLAIYKKGMNGVVPQVGDKLVQMGNTTDKSRQGCILLTTEASMPRMAILDGIDEPKIYNTPEKTNYKGIYGSLENFVDPYTGKKLSGYGMWGENVHLHGDLILSSTNKSVSDSLKDVGNGRNLLLGTNRGVENWLLSTSLDKGNYTISEEYYNDAKGVCFEKITSEQSSWGELLLYSLRPQFIEKSKPYHLSFDAKQSSNNEEPLSIELRISLSTSQAILTNTSSFRIITTDDEWHHYDIELVATDSGVINGGQMVNFVISKQQYNWYDISIANLKLEEGSKATSWSQAPEDAQYEYDRLAELANNAQTTADNAQSLADEAKSKSYLAQSSANAAKERLDAWAEDGVISPNEKQGLKDELARIEGDYNDITDRFDRASLDSPSGYIEAYNAYTDMLSYLINESAISGKETTDIPEDFAEIQENYYQQKVNAYYDLYDSSLASAENAQSMADAIAQTTATLTQDIININNRLDGVVENWFYKGYPTPQNAPAIEWTNAQEKYNHIGDTFTSIDENGDYAGKSWRWIGVTVEPSFEIDFTTGSINGVTYYFYWQTIADSDAIKALRQAQEAQDTADGKRRVFVAQPTTPYDEGDLWVKTENGVTTIYYCVTSKADGNVFSNNDWQLAATDNSALQAFIDGNFKVEISNLKTQIDKKAETWYQSTDPSSQWHTDDLKNLHIGDMWYNTNNNTTHRWNGSLWEEQNIPKSVFDTIDGKAQIFVTTPTPPYNIGDLWVQGDSGDILRCKAGRSSGNYNPSDWVKASKYTDDTALNDYKEVVSGEFEVTNGKFASIQNTITVQGNKIEANTSLINQTANNISLTIKSLTWDNQNLLLNSSKVINDRNYLLGFYDLGDFKPINNSKVTLSFSGYLGNGHGMFKIYNSGWQTQITTLNVSDYNPTTQRYEKTFDWVIGNTENTYINIFQADTNGNAITDYGDASIVASKIYNIKLEFSSKATSWTPAPEDTNQALKDTGIDIKSKKITVTADNFQVQNNEGDPTLSVDENGNLVTNTLQAVNQNQNPLISANVNNSGFLVFYYPHKKGQRQMEMGWDAESKSLMRYYDEDDNMLWKIGNASAFVKPDYTEWTTLSLYKVNDGGIEALESAKTMAKSQLTFDMSYYYQHNNVGSNNVVYVQKDINSEKINGWFTPHASPQTFDTEMSGLYYRSLRHYTNGIPDYYVPDKEMAFPKN